MPAVISGWGPAFAAIAWLMVALLLLARRSPQATPNEATGWLLCAVVCEAAWAAQGAVTAWFGQSILIGAGLEALRPALFAGWMLMLLRQAYPARLLRLALGLAVVLAVAQVAGQALLLASTLNYSLALLAAIYCILITEQVYRNAVPDQRWLLKYACLASFLMFGFDSFMRADALLYGAIDPSLQAAQPFVDALIAPMMALGGLRLLPRRLQLRFSREAAFHTATLMVSGLFLLAMAALGYGLRTFGTSWGGVLQWIILFASASVLLVLLGSGHVRAQVRVLINKHFFSHRYDYRKEWLRLTRLLSSSGEQAGRETATPLRCLQALVEMIESRGGRLWTQDDAGVWRVRAQLNSGHAPDLQADDPLAHFLGQSGWIMDIDAWRDGRRPEGAPVIPHWLKADPEAWVMMAISVQSSPVALVQLQNPLAPIPIDWETRDLLKAAGQQAAGLLRMEQVLESLVQARQFESFNRMSAFVVHDLKNLVAQLGLMLRNADRHRDNPEFQADMLDTVANAQQRMQSMLLQLRAGTQPIEAAHPIDLDACLKRVVTERSWPEPGPQLDLRTHEDRRTDPSAGPKILGHPERLERVVGHLIQNGIDASPSTASVRIIRRMDLNQVVIEVMDQGCGMTEQFIEQELFRPFRSTKAHGMGIGAFESREYIREIGGDLSVRSLPDRGTSFEIRLPVWSEPA